MSNESQIPNPESRPLWYVVQTKPLSENSVQQLFKNAKLETFLPKIKTIVRGKSKPQERIKSLFPSYLFLHVDLKNTDIYRMIKFTRGVRKVLGDGNVPIPVPDEMIEIIRKRAGEGGVIEQQIVMKKGDKVRVSTGPFKDLIGILDKPVSASGRVRVLLGIMQTQIKCDLSVAYLERVTE